jgi:hypothetical protein
VLGDARKASAKKGEKLLDVAAELLAAKLVAGEPWDLKSTIRPPAPVRRRTLIS